MLVRFPLKRKFKNAILFIEISLSVIAVLSNCLRWNRKEKKVAHQKLARKKSVLSCFDKRTTQHNGIKWRRNGSGHRWQ